MGMDLFDGHCDTMTRCYRYGYGIRENFGNQDLERAEYIGCLLYTSRIIDLLENK